MATSTLDHPNTVGVRHFDVTAEGEPYLVMDFLEGRSLAQVLAEEERLDAQRVVKILTQMAQALAYAHAKGIVHRDLKASNILLVENEGTPDFVKIIDFGIAKVMAGENSETITANVTMTGEIFGSPLAMSPEQCRGEKVDHRSDIYSFGCVMYQMLTGKPVFQANNTLEVLFKQMHEMPDNFKDACPDVKIPPQLEVITMKALQKNPKQRYQSMQELLDNLQVADKTSALDLAVLKLGLAAQNRKRNRIMLVLGAVLAIAAVGAGTAFFMSSRLQHQNGQSLLGSKIDWQLPQLKPLSTPKVFPQARQEAVQEAKDYISKNIDPKRGKLGALNLTAGEAKVTLEKLHQIAQHLNAVGATDELIKLSQDAQLTGAAYKKEMDQAHEQLLSVSKPIKQLKEIGDMLYGFRDFKDAFPNYATALELSENVAAPTDGAYLRKLIGDCNFAMAETAPSSNRDAYTNASTEYMYSLKSLGTTNDLKIFPADVFAYANGRKYPITPSDLSISPLAWDAHRKWADSLLLRNQSPDYAKAVDQYRWCADHGWSYLDKIAGEVTLFLWRKADAERLSGLNALAPSQPDIDAARQIFRDYRDGLANDAFKNPRNTALCHAYMAELAKVFNLPREEWSGKYVSMSQALAEMRKEFGADNPTTKLLESDDADILWNEGNYLKSVILQSHIH